MRLKTCKAPECNNRQPREQMLGRNEITLESLREALDYDSQTGEFSWRIATSPRARVGGIAGCEDTSSGYWVVGFLGRLYRAHRLAWFYEYGRFPELQIDHINGDRLDNRISNLREVTNQENHKNKKLAANNKTGVPGVVFESGAWRARITADGSRLGLGRYSDYFEAVCARKSAENRHGFHRNHGRHNA